MKTWIVHVQLIRARMQGATLTHQPTAAAYLFFHPTHLCASLGCFHATARSSPATQPPDESSESSCAQH